MANSGTHGSSGGPPLPSYNSSQNPGASSYRRTSYASVLSGVGGSVAPQTYNPLYRTPQLPSLTSASGIPSLSTSNPHSRNPSRGIDTGAHHSGLSSSRGREGTSYSGPFGSFGGFTAAAVDIMKPDPSRSSFFIPSYLRGSRHAERLEEAHKASLAAARDSRSAHSSNAGSLSTSASSVNLHKVVPSHRGLATEVIERAPPPPIFAEDVPAPLPMRWNEHDKFPGLDILNGGLELKYNGVPKPHESEAAAVRADQPMPRECGIYYFEVTVVSKSKDGLISIGFSGPKVPLNRLPGWEPESWAYHGDDGMTFCSTSSGKHYGPRYSTTDVIGCGVNFRTGCAFFTKNGVYLDVAFRDIRSDRLYPAVGVKRPNEHLRVNFGLSPFVFDIDSMVQGERNAVMEQIEKTSVSSLHPPLTESQLTHRLIAQYLAHDGYVETARAFAEEVQTEQRALLRDGADTRDLEPEEDLHAVRRQKVRRAILKGDMDNALALTREYYPSVLRDNENIYFKLRCRKFVEMIRQTTELHEISPLPTKKPASNGRSHDEYNDVFNHQMELDEQLGAGGYQNGTTRQHDNGTDWENAMDTSDDPSLGMKSLEETIQYGQELKAEFSEDPRREVKKALEDTLALIAYADPREGPLKELLDERGRVPVAEELNGAILVSLGKSSSAALERLVQQTVVLLNELGEDGGAGAFINVRDFLQ